MDEQPKDGEGGRPGLFNNMTAWVGGATALVVALGGLATATGNLWPKKQAVETPATAGDTSETAVPEEENAGDSAQAQDPESYTVEGGDGGTLVKVEGQWVWTGADGARADFDEESNDGTTVVAVVKQDDGDAYLRWPVNGGTAFQSFDGKKTWTEPVKVTPNDQG